MNTDRIDIVPVEGLAARLAFSRIMSTPLGNVSKDFCDFKMEREDAPVFRYIYRNFRPTRHLEFGTWEGFGVTLCASECDAEIWTINAPEGEKDQTGSCAAYSRSFQPGERVPEGAVPIGRNDEGFIYQTDAGVFIGWMYRDAGYARRVHQIYSDSCDWDASEFAPGFFDSILIDGGHTPDLVKNDTDKALPLLRSGGICMWHDFCPEPVVLRDMPASRGVVRAIVDNYGIWRGHLADLFWINPTFILLGVKR